MFFARTVFDALRFVEPAVVRHEVIVIITAAQITGKNNFDSYLYGFVHLEVYVHAEP